MRGPTHGKSRLNTLPDAFKSFQILPRCYTSQQRIPFPTHPGSAPKSQGRDISLPTCCCQCQKSTGLPLRIRCRAMNIPPCRRYARGAACVMQGRGGMCMPLQHHQHLSCSALCQTPLQQAGQQPLHRRIQHWRSLSKMLLALMSHSPQLHPVQNAYASQSMRTPLHPVVQRTQPHQHAALVLRPAQSRVGIPCLRARAKQQNTAALIHSAQCVWACCSAWTACLPLLLPRMSLQQCSSGTARAAESGGHWRPVLPRTSQPRSSKS